MWSRPKARTIARDTLVLLLVAGHRPVAVRPQVFVEVAAVQIDQVIAALDDLLRHDVRRAIGLRALRIARIEPVHVLVVRRVDVRHDALERRDVHERHQDERAGELRRLDRVDQLLDRDDRRVLRAVRARDDREHRARLRAVHDHDRDVVAGVRAGRHLQHAIGFLTALGRRGPDREGRTRVLAAATSRAEPPLGSRPAGTGREQQTDRAPRARWSSCAQLYNAFGTCI